MVERLTIIGEAGGAVGHDALALGGADGGAEIGFSGLAEEAFAAFGGVERDDVVARFYGRDAFADFDDDAGAFVAEDDREEAFGVIAREGERVGVADARIGDLDQHFALLGRGDVDLDDFQGLSGCEGNGSTGFHLGHLLFGRQFPLGTSGTGPAQARWVSMAGSDCICCANSPREWIMQLRDKTLFRQAALVGDRWVEADGAGIAVTNPATGEVIGHVPKLGARETREAIEFAEGAQKAWAKRTAKERSNILRRWFELMIENKEDLGKILTLEQGKPVAEATGRSSMARASLNGSPRRRGGFMAT